MKKTYQSIIGTGSKSIHMVTWIPERSEPKGVIQIVHGMAEHSERYNHVARRLTGSGFAVMAHDHRGHGKTDPDHPGYIDSGRSDHFDLMAADAHQIFLKAASEFPGLPVIIIGHSMGSFLVQRMMQQLPQDESTLPAAIIYSGSNGKPPFTIHAGMRLAAWIESFKGPAFKSMLIHHLTFGAFNKPFEPSDSEFEWLSRDHSMVQLYEDDPYCGFTPSVSFYRHLFRGLINLHKHRPFPGIHTHIPVLLIAGEKDPVSGMGKGIPHLKRSLIKGGVQKTDTKIYPGARHELFNETNRDEILSDVLMWIEGNVGFQKN
jgi:alpha-beta hydrolase superfamily lysophospholipase